MNFNHLFMCFALHSSITLAHSAGSFSDSDECPVFFVPSDVITNHLDSQQFEYTSDTMRYPPGAETMDQPGSTEAADRQSAQSHFEDIHDLHALSTASWLSRSPVSWYQAFSDTTDEIQRQALIAKDCDALS
ncbi:MAG: hypothetical protein Q8K36_03375, partial [Alphaproteobacteria bacterium]|nr:hypothetical protein [Alphaproteobacteria bacterium]